MRVCRALVDAEKAYYAKSPGAVGKQYAQRFVSDAGRYNGLFWWESDNKLPSPIGPLVAYAGSEGAAPQRSTQPTPYHGYYYRLLTRQGSHAPGGALHYVLHGKMTRGFAFVAYPAAYRSSGVMTFIVNQDGIVYEKDLGEQTADITQSFRAYNPDKTWHRVDEY